MSFLTAMSPLERWQGHEPKSSNSFQIVHFEQSENHTDGTCSSFHGIVQRELEDMRNTQQESRTISTGVENVDVQDTRSFMQTFLPTVSAISNSGELNIMHCREDCGSLLNEGSSELEIDFPYLPQKRYNGENDSSAKKLVMPPTPNSGNIHAINSHGYIQSDYQQLHSVDDGLQMHGNDHEIVSTPLVSPAVSPLDYQFNGLGYSFAEAYLSPLTSPALQAQNDFSPLYDQRSSWVTDSPVLNHDCFSINEFPVPRAQNFDDKVSKMQSLNGFRVNKSPVVNQKRGIKGPNTFSKPLDAMDFSYLPTSNYESSAYSHLPLEKTQDTCPNSSENLSNCVSNIFPSHDLGKAPSSLNIEDSNSLACSFGSNIPATPASLMKITHLSMHTPKLEPTRTHDVSSVNSRDASLTPLCSHEANSNVEASLNSGSNIIESESLSMQSPVRERGNSATNSHSPRGDYPGTIATSLCKSQFGMRSSKKRNSSLNVASPALLPRISPNIKPLIHSGGKELEDSASLILAHKSNYQNILDGTYLPGITYSSELSANLTSKRTSHKIAEQGRRNRMNSALQEIASLLPCDQKKNVGCEKNKNSDVTGSERSNKGISPSTNSKARTVERAISYINYLKSQLEIANEKLEQIESEKKP